MAAKGGGLRFLFVTGFLGARFLKICKHGRLLRDSGSLGCTGLPRRFQGLRLGLFVSVIRISVRTMRDNKETYQLE